MGEACAFREDHEQRRRMRHPHALASSSSPSPASASATRRVIIHGEQHRAAFSGQHELQQLENASANNSVSNSKPLFRRATARASRALPAPEKTATRAIKSSSERGRVFRQRQKQYEKDLAVQVLQLRAQIAQSSARRDLVRKERALRSRTSHTGSLVKLVRELCIVLRYGLRPQEGENDQTLRHTVIQYESDETHWTTQYKEDFVRHVMDPDVQLGDLIGVEKCIDQIHKHTASYSKFELELGHAQVIVNSKENPIVAIDLKLHVRFSRESLPVMFPRALEQNPELSLKFLDRDLILDCTTRFQFSDDSGVITAYSLQINFVEVFVKAVGSARDVAELMRFSIVTKYATLEEEGARSAHFVRDGDNYGPRADVDFEQQQPQQYLRQHGGSSRTQAF